MRKSFYVRARKTNGQFSKPVENNGTLNVELQQRDRATLVGIRIQSFEQANGSLITKVYDGETLVHVKVTIKPGSLNSVPSK